MILDKDAKVIQQKKDGIFNNWYWSNQLSACRRIRIYYPAKQYLLTDKWILTMQTAQVQVDQGPQHKNKYSKSSKGETGKQY